MVMSMTTSLDAPWGSSSDAAGSIAEPAIIDIDLSGTDGGTDDESSESTPATDNGAARPAKATAPAAKPASLKAQKPLLRRIAKKTVEISAAPKARRALLAGLLGCDDDVVELTVAALSGAAPASTADLFALATAEPMQAGMMAAEIAGDKNRMKALWSLLELLSLTTKSQPAKVNEAGLEAATAAHGMSSSVRSDLNAALALLN